MKKAIALAWTRDFTLTWAEWWSRDMDPRVKEVFGKGIPNQLSFFNGRLLETYRPVDESADFIKAVVEQSLRSSVLSQKAIQRYVFLNKQIRSMLKNSRNSLISRSIFKKIMRATAEMYPWYTACYLLPQEPWVNKLIEKRPTESKAIIKRLLKAREQSEGTIEELIEYWRAVAHALLKVRNISSAHSSFVTFSELEKMLEDKNYHPDREKLHQRSRQYIFFRDSVYVGPSRQAFFRKHNFTYTVEPISASKEIKGTVSCSGPSSIKGTVSLILRNDEVRNFQPGNILVTVMTNPFFIPIMKKAKAIVTDEGGVTCHAAIVARELKKPCVIGTKIATKVLKDGDRVEVDAIKGIVRKL